MGKCDMGKYVISPRVSILLPLQVDLLKSLNRIAQEKGISRLKLIKLILQEYIERKEIDEFQKRKR